MLTKADIADIISEYLSRGRDAAAGIALKSEVKAAAAPVPKASKPLPKRIFISDWEMKRLVKPGQKSVRIPARAIVSPLSQDWLDYNGVEILRDC